MLHFADFIIDLHLFQCQDSIFYGENDLKCVLYKSAWTKNTLFKLSFVEQYIAHNFVQFIYKLKPSHTGTNNAFSPWTANQIIESAQPFLEHSYEAATVCFSFFFAVYLYLIKLAGDLCFVF